MTPFSISIETCDTAVWSMLTCQVFRSLVCWCKRKQPYIQLGALDDVREKDALGLLEFVCGGHVLLGDIRLERLHVQPEHQVLHAPALDRVRFKALSLFCFCPPPDELFNKCHCECIRDA